MRYFLGFAVSCFLSITSFAQDAQTITLVFVTPANDNARNYEAVIDDVSYFSENNAAFNNQDSRGTSSAKRNTIYLNNFQAGRHTIQVYSLRNGSSDERNGNTPVYSSAFNVREGFDTRISIRGNGQVQFSERQSAFNNTADNSIQRNDNEMRRNDNTPASNNIGRDNDRNNNNSNDADQRNSTADGTYNTPGNYNRNDDAISSNSTPNNNGSYNQNAGANRRSATKRDETFTRNDNTGSTREDANQNNKVNIDPSDSGNRNFGGEKNNDQVTNNGSGHKRAHINTNPAMADYQFNYLYETFSKQWLPGQKMKSINNEFANSGDNFTTVQASKLISLVTEEGNRLQLAKSAYHTITDPENFSQVYDLLKLESSRADLDRYIGNLQDQ